MYFSIGSIPIWSTREQINEEKAEIFKRTHPSTHCILDCTELYCQRPSSLSTHSSLYSHYKDHVTYKALIVVSLSSAIIFVSELHDGSISDEEIVRKSGILEKESVMADRGFTIESDSKELKVDLNIPFFLGERVS